MKKYRIKPIEVEAMQFTGSNASEILSYANCLPDITEWEVKSELCPNGDWRQELWISYKYGGMIVGEGDWLALRSTDGDFTLKRYSPREFESKYEPITDLDLA